MVLIGTFLNSAAQSGYRQALIRQALRGEPVSRFMNRESVVVPPDVDLRHWVEGYVYRHYRKGFRAAADGHVQGVINTQDPARFPRQQWERHTATEAMQPSTEGSCVAPDVAALEALERVQCSGSSRLLVTEGDRLVGLVTLKDLLKFLDLKLHLEPAGR